MSEYVEGAHGRHGRGYNCAQAVACSFAERVGVDESLLFRAFLGHGLGMGGMEGTCGALTGACAVVGLAISDGNLEGPVPKGPAYAVSRRIVERFAEEVGATQCRAIKGVGTGKVLKSCDDCIRIAARLAEEEVPFKDGLR